MDTTTHVSHAKILDRENGPTAIASIIGVNVALVKGWKRNDSIPSGYWKSFIDNGLASYRELAEAAEQRVRQRATS